MCVLVTFSNYQLRFKQLLPKNTQDRFHFNQFGSSPCLFSQTTDRGTNESYFARKIALRTPRRLTLAHQNPTGGFSDNLVSMDFIRKFSASILAKRTVVSIPPFQLALCCHRRSVTTPDGSIARARGNDPKREFSDGSGEELHAEIRQRHSRFSTSVTRIVAWAQVQPLSVSCAIRLELQRTPLSLSVFQEDGLTVRLLRRVDHGFLGSQAIRILIEMLGLASLNHVLTCSVDNAPVPFSH